MPFLRRLRDKRNQPVAEKLERRIRALYAQHDRDMSLAYTALYDELSGAIDVATIILLIQIAIYIWQWMQSRNVSAKEAFTIELPEFEFEPQHEKALGAWNSASKVL